MKKINFNTFATFSVLLVLLTIPGCFAYGSLDEGQQGGRFMHFQAKYFEIISFPINYSLLGVINSDSISSWIKITVFIVGLVADALLYALLIERLIYLVKKYIFKSKSLV